MPSAGICLRSRIHAAFLSQRHSGEHHRADGYRNCHIEQQLHQVYKDCGNVMVLDSEDLLLHAGCALRDPELNQTCEPGHHEQPPA